jgi:hypothetical protein
MCLSRFLINILLNSLPAQVLINDILIAILISNYLQQEVGEGLNLSFQNRSQLIVL